MAVARNVAFLPYHPPTPPFHSDFPAAYFSPRKVGHFPPGGYRLGIEPWRIRRWTAFLELKYFCIFLQQPQQPAMLRELQGFEMY